MSEGVAQAVTLLGGASCGVPCDMLMPKDSGAYSTVTLFARFRGRSTSHLRRTAMWYANS